VNNQKYEWLRDKQSIGKVHCGIVQMLAGKTSGLWSSYLEEQYAIVFHRKLQLNFGVLVEQLADIIYVER